MIFRHYTSREKQAQSLAAMVASQLRAAIDKTGCARLALAGGATPQLFLGELARENLPWESVRLTLTDERQVAADSPRSNLRFIREHLAAIAGRVRLIPLYDAATPDTDSLIAVIRSNMLPLDVCVLGMGEDGHFASLFPGATNLQAGLDPDNATPLLSVEAPALPEARVSLSLAALLSAPHLHLLIQGKTKRQVLDAAADASPPLPVASLLRHAKDKLTVHYAD